MEQYTSRTSKGQLSSFDLVVALMLFLVVITMVIWSGAETHEHVWRFESTQSYKDKAVDAINVLLKTEGQPWYWETLDNLSLGNIRSLGLVSEPSVLDREKLNRFGDIPYNQSRRMLGLSKEGYFIEVLNHRNVTIYEFGVVSEASAVFERPAILENMTVTFKLGLFEQ